MTIEIADTPLTSTALYPLHGWDYGKDYACQRPEDPDCRVFDFRCPACLLAAQAVLVTSGDEVATWRRDAESPERPIKLSWLIDRSLYWSTQP